MPTDAGRPNVVSHTPPARAGTPADQARRVGAPPSQLRSATTIRAREAPTVEVPLTWARPRPATPWVVRLYVAWLLFGTFGLASLLASSRSDPRTGALIGSGLSLPLYVLTVGALVWAAFETGRATHRQSRRHARSEDDILRRAPTVCRVDQAVAE